MNNTIYTLSHYASGELKDTYKEEEIHSICRLIFVDVFHYTNIDIHIKKHENLPESFADKFYDIVTRLKQGEPIQYITGMTEFAGLPFSVNPSTLIPRPETEELVQWIKERVPCKARILDIGTGSGCIAVSLAHFFPDSLVTAIDLSETALEVARHNALLNGARVVFKKADIFRYEKEEWDKYDLIVSNPPYVRLSEKSSMQRQVVDFEPSQALFVSDEDPLIYYRKIAEFGCRQLRPGGLLFFEINEALGAETVALLGESGYSDLELKKDIFDKERFVKGKK